MCSGNSIQSVTEEQYYLASRANISISESNELPDFEREAFISMVVKDLKQKEETEKAMKQQQSPKSYRQHK